MKHKNVNKKSFGVLFFVAFLFCFSVNPVLALTIQPNGQLIIDDIPPLYIIIIYDGNETNVNYSFSVDNFAIYGGTVDLTVQSVLNYAGGNWPTTEVTNWYRVDLPGFASCGYQPDNRSCIESVALDSVQQFDSANIPTPPAPVQPIRFSLFATSTPPPDLLALVAGGVQETGQAVWPLFAFAGVSLAFVIALQLVVFTKRATYTGSETGTGKAENAPYRDASGRFAKLPRQGDYKAFKRGKQANKDDGINLFD